MRKLVMTLVIAALVGSGCGGGGGKDDEGGQYGSDLLTATTGTVAPGATAAPTTVATASGGKKTATTRRGSSGGGGGGATVPANDPIRAFTEAPGFSAGSFGGMLLGSNSPVKKIVYELMLQEGKDLKQATLDHVVGKLRTFSGKPVTVERTPLPPGPGNWTPATAHEYADRFTRFQQGNGVAVMHVLVVRGTFGGASGAASRGDVLTMLPDVYSKGNVAISPDTVEDIVAMHETGHLLGLVDIYLSLGRGDYRGDPAPGGHHSKNKRSVMYWTVDQLSVSSVFEGGPPREFDADDEADLRAIHNNAPRGAKTRG